MKLTTHEIHAALTPERIILAATDGPGLDEVAWSIAITDFVRDHPEMAEPLADVIARAVATTSRIVEKNDPDLAQHLEPRARRWTGLIRPDDLWTDVLFSTERPDYLTGDHIITGPCYSNGTGFTAWCPGNDIDTDERLKVSTWRTTEQVHAIQERHDRRLAAAVTHSTKPT